MRQTLLRIRLDDLWSLSPVEGTTAVGLGYVVLLVWLAIAAKWALTHLRTNGFARSDMPGVLLWAGSAVVALVLGGTLGARASSIPVFGYGFMLFLGFLAGAWLASRRARRSGLGPDVVWDLAVWVMIAGIGGARLFYVVQHSERVFAGRTGLDRVWAVFNLPDGGLVLYGGVVLALTAFYLFCRRRGIAPLLMADVVIPSFFVGLAFGRVGCFLNGCCYGDPAAVPWAVCFPRGSVPFAALVHRGVLDAQAAATMPMHPTQLYSAVNALVLAVLTATFFRYRRRNGAVLGVALCAYPVTRFVLEYLRADELGVTIPLPFSSGAAISTPLTISQWVSTLLFCGGLAYVFWLRRRPADSAGSPGSEDSAAAA